MPPLTEFTFNFDSLVVGRLTLFWIIFIDCVFEVVLIISIYTREYEFLPKVLWNEAFMYVSLDTHIWTFGHSYMNVSVASELIYVSLIVITLYLLSSYILSVWDYKRQININYLYDLPMKIIRKLFFLQLLSFVMEHNLIRAINSHGSPIKYWVGCVLNNSVNSLI